MSGLRRRQLLVRAAYLAPIIVLSPSHASAAPRPPLVAAISAKAAFDSYGINCHFSFLSDSTWGNTDSGTQWLERLGAGAVRQALPRSPHGRVAVKSAMDRLGARGVRWCCPVLGSADTGSLDTARAAVNSQLCTARIESTYWPSGRQSTCTSGTGPRAQAAMSRSTRCPSRSRSTPRCRSLCTSRPRATPPVQTFTAQTFTQSVGGGMQILQIG